MTTRFCYFVMGCLLIAPASFAVEIDGLVNTLAEKGIISYGEAQQIISDSKQEARAKLAAGRDDTLPSWLQNISVKGDLRLRHQVDWDSSKSFARTRERLRLRLGLETRIVEGLKAGFGLATGRETAYDVTVPTATGQTGSTGSTAFITDGEPSSTNWTFGYDFAKPVVMVDYAFLEYEPADWLKATAGKMKAGTNVWNATDLLWDTDINPDGIAVTGNRNLSDTVNVFLTGSWMTFNGDKANNTNAPAPDVYIAQPGVLWKPNENIDLKAAFAFQQFNVQNKTLYYYQGVKTNGSLGTPPAFDYHCWNPSVNFVMREVFADYFLNVFGDMVQNKDSAVTSDNQGSSYGLRIGNEKITKLGEWQLVGMLRKLETNAWLNKLGDSDTYGGNVDSSGFEAIATIGLTPSTTFGIDYYSMNRIKGATRTTPQQLIQLDVVCKF